MRNIGISTHYTNSCNYGGVLQAYALCTQINNWGNNAAQIRYVFQNDSFNKRLKRAITERKIFILIINKCISYMHLFINRISRASLCIKKRNEAFGVFRDSIPHTRIIYNNNNINACDTFDIYITGSDQVWRIEKDNKINELYWLTFVAKNKIKVSYAASISTNGIPKELHQEIKEILSDYKAISVREKQDKELLDKIIGKDKVQWVLDPTLLLLRNDWEKLCEENPFKGKNYVFAYLLGDNKKQRSFVTEWAKKNNKIVINIPYLLGTYRSCDRKFGDIRKSDVTPNLWLSLIRDADCVFTDSFHACVFSSIFHTPFYVFKRSKDTSKYSMNSRIYSLMELYDAEERIIDDDVAVDSLASLNSIGFDRIDERIGVEREKSLDFLKNALEG